MIDWQSGVKYRISSDTKKQIEKITTYAKVDDYDQKIFHFLKMFPKMQKKN